MTLDELLVVLRMHQAILVSADEVWTSSVLTPAIKRALHKHRAGLRLLIAWNSIETCPARDLHRRYWRYSRGRYTCGICERIGA